MKPAQRNMKQKVCQVSSILVLKTTPGVFRSNGECFVFVGQMRLWNPDEPSTPRGSNAPPSTSLEERLQEACSELMISWDGYASHVELLVLSEHLGLKVRPKHFVEIDPCILKKYHFPVKPGFAPESIGERNHECRGVCFQGFKLQQGTDSICLHPVQAA